MCISKNTKNKQILSEYTFRYGNRIAGRLIKLFFSQYIHVCFLTTLDNACTSGGRLKLYLRYWFTRVGEIIAFPYILPLQISLPNTIYLVVEASLYYSDWSKNRTLSLCFVFSEQPSINLATACTLLKADCVLTPGTG